MVAYDDFSHLSVKELQEYMRSVLRMEPPHDDGDYGLHESYKGMIIETILVNVN